METAQKAQTSQKTDSLDQKYQQAVDLRLLGFSYSKIAVVLSEAGFKVHENTVRHWFSRRGVCFKAYNLIRKERLSELDRSLKDAESQLKEGAIDSIALLRKEVLGGNVRAATEILDRIGFIKQERPMVEPPRQLDSNILRIRRMVESALTPEKT